MVFDSDTGHFEYTTRRHARSVPALPDQSLAVILIETDKVYARLLNQTLRQQGARLGTKVHIKIIEFLTAAEQEMARGVIPDVVVVDLNTPDAPLAVLLQHLGNFSKNVPVVVLANDGDEVHALEALGHGITEYMIKQRGAHERLMEVILRARQRWQIAQHQFGQIENQQRERRLVALGTMAGAVAHEFNNLVTVLLGNLDLVNSDINLSTKTRSRVERCIDSLQRSQNLADGLIDLAAGGRTLETSCDMAGILNQVVDLMTPEMEDNGIELQTAGLGQPVHVIGHADQLRQVIINLVRNARYAFTEQRSPRISIEVTQNHDEVAIAVTDNGCGMSESVLKRVFDPFFSTRQASSGTGLGLSVCEAIINRCGGEIYISSLVGEGTTVHIHLNSVTQDESKAGRKAASLRRQRVLVVEDEAILRNLLCDVLVSEGIDVVVAADGAEGAKKLRDSEQQGDPIDLVMLDWAMPQYDGYYFLDKSHRLIENNRTMVVVFSGNRSQFDMQVGGYAQYVCEVLNKPCPMNQLLAILEKYLESASSPAYQAIHK